MTGRRHRSNSLQSPASPDRRSDWARETAAVTVRRIPATPWEQAANAAASRSEARGRKETAPRQKAASLWHGIYKAKSLQPSGCFPHVLPKLSP